jgi:hypothetical protein
MNIFIKTKTNDSSKKCSYMILCDHDNHGMIADGHKVLCMYILIYSTYI